jgi:hypothetical protein
MLASAREHYRRQQRITTAGLVAARKARRKGAFEVAKVVTAFQILASRDAVESVSTMLAEQGIVDAPASSVIPTSLAGVASDGRALDTLFEQAKSEFQFALMVATQLQDAARGAASVSIASRSRVGYIRMLNPPSCSRCAILAGKWYGWNEGFQRHPKCDCRHVPTTEDVAGDLTTNPDAYFRSLGQAEQDRIFTNAGAQAIRDGADMSRVVNARSGMATAPTATGRRIAQRNAAGELRTTAGTTRRGRLPGQITGPRLMPESIYELATDRAHAQRLLKLHGYIT